MEMSRIIERLQMCRSLGFAFFESPSINAFSAHFLQVVKHLSLVLFLSFQYIFFFILKWKEHPRQSTLVSRFKWVLDQSKTARFEDPGVAMKPWNHLAAYHYIWSTVSYLSELSLHKYFALSAIFCFFLSVWGPLNTTQRLITGVCLPWPPSRRLMVKTTHTQYVIVHIIVPDVTIKKYRKADGWWI